MESIAEFDTVSQETRDQLEKVMQGKGGTSRRTALQKLTALTEKSTARFGEFAHAALETSDQQEALESIANEYLGDEDALLALCRTYNPTGEYVAAESKQAIIDYLAAAPEDPHNFAAMMYRGAVRDNVRACTAMAPENTQELADIAANIESKSAESPAARIKQAATIAFAALRSVAKKRK